MVSILDRLGRLKLPQELVEQFGWDERSAFGILYQGGVLRLIPLQPETEGPYGEVRTLDRTGRLVLPAGLRAWLGLRPGSVATVHVTEAGDLKLDFTAPQIAAR